VLDAVAVGQGGGEVSEGVGHGPHVTCGLGRQVARLSHGRRRRLGEAHGFSTSMTQTSLC
jgi:hypothetical protein